MKLTEIDKKRQALIDDMIKDCNDDPRLLTALVEDYVWTFKEDLVEMLYENR